MHYLMAKAMAALVFVSVVGSHCAFAQMRQVEDWVMWGGDPSRNMVRLDYSVSIDFSAPLDGARSRNLAWTVELGSQTYSPPTVHGGKVFIGTNNGAGYRPNHVGDRGCLLCFRESDGEFLWQLTREKLASGRVNDWPQQGIVSVACVERDRLWIVTNRAELMCLDTEGFYDEENDGALQDELDHEKEDADIVWSLDMIEELGVFPHNLAISSPVVLDDIIYVMTSNGVDESHKTIPSPRSPTIIAVDKRTGELVWEDNSPFDNILHGQWSSPTIGQVDGEHQVYMAGGDGWLYALDAADGELVWKFDLNPKNAVWKLGGRGDRNSVIATPVFVDQSVVIAVGQDPEHGEGVGYLYRIDATKEGDVSWQLPNGDLNPNSALIWRYGGLDDDGSVTGEIGHDIFRRTLATASVAYDLVFIPDTSGRVHCVDFKTGERCWEYDLLAQIWGGAMVADRKVFITDEDGVLTIMEADRNARVIGTKEFSSSIYGHMVIANEKIFIADRSRLYAFHNK